MNRRGFITTLASGLAVASVDPEALERLLWKPMKTFFIPPESDRIITLKAYVQQINYSIFDVETTGSQSGQYAYLEPKDLGAAVKELLQKHDEAMWTPDMLVVPPKLHKVVDRILRPPTLLERLFGL